MMHGGRGSNLTTRVTNLSNAGFPEVDDPTTCFVGIFVKHRISFI